MSTDLKKSCKQILQRLQQQNVAEFSCVLCGQHVRGQDALMLHLITGHHIHCVHFDNVSNLPELLSHLSQLLHCEQSSPSHWTCPVCGHDTQSTEVDVLLQHVQQKGHTSWNPSTIPSLAPWCVIVNSCTQSDAAVENSITAAVSTPVDSKSTSQPAEDDDTACDDMEDEEVDEDEDWNLDCVCLYCDYDGEDILEHLKSTHDFDFRAAVQQRADVKSEYDLIRIVNTVRRAVGADRCPFDESCPIDGKHNDRASLEEHLKAEQSHRLPARISESDADLIPVLPGDAFISLLVTSGAGFLKMDEEDPDFPMVPTVQELAAAARNDNKL